MKILRIIPVVLFFVITSAIPSKSQVKISEYQPLNMNEMLLLPRIKSQKYDANMNKLINLGEKFAVYFDVNDVDNLFEFEIKILANDLIKLSEGDLAVKDAEIQKLDYRFQKITRDFEAREREGVTRLNLSHGSPIYNIPDHPLENTSIRLLGHSSKENTFIIGKHNDEYLKVQYKQLNGYVHKRFLE